MLKSYPSFPLNYVKLKISDFFHYGVTSMISFHIKSSKSDWSNHNNYRKADCYLSLENFEMENTLGTFKEFSSRL